MESGQIVKNGNSTFFVLAVEDNKALLCRQSDCETVVAVDFKEISIENGITTIEWGFGHYFGNYMNHVLEMLEGLKELQEHDPVYVKTSAERAAFLASFGDKVFEAPLEAFATEEAAMRADDFIPEMLEEDELTPERVEEIHDWVAGQLYNYLQNNEQALNYDGMDDITLETITEYITEMDTEIDRE